VAVGQVWFKAAVRGACVSCGSEWGLGGYFRLFIYVGTKERKRNKAKATTMDVDYA